MIYFYTPENASENQKISDFFRGLEMEHWARTSWLIYFLNISYSATIQYNNP